MKVEMNWEGTLFITPRNAVEKFALDSWYKDLADVIAFEGGDNSVLAGFVEIGDLEK